MPGPVDDYFKQVKKNNPSYTDEQAWATAWSIYCKNKAPGSPHCHKDPSEYLRKASIAERVAFRYEQKETKAHKVERLADAIREKTGLSKGQSSDIADAFVRGREVERLALQKNWPVEAGVLTGPKGEIQLSELSSFLN